MFVRVDVLGSSETGIERRMIAVTVCKGGRRTSWESSRMPGPLHRLWETLGRWLRRPRAPASGPALDTEDRGGRVGSRARVWAELREGQREAAARASQLGP
jgi:hypothetical protein